MRGRTARTVETGGAEGPERGGLRLASTTSTPLTAFTAFTALTVFSASRSVAQNLETVLARAEQAYRATSSFRAEFTQTIVNPMLGSPEGSRGVVFLEPPDHFAMRFSDPAGDRIVADGTWLWLYAPSSVPEQVIRQPVPRVGPTTPNLVAQFVDRPLERYEAAYLGSDVVRGDTVDVVRLVPREPDLPFGRAEIAVARQDGLLRRIVLLEPPGQERTLVFERIATNVAIPRSEFRFAVPPGVRVITP